ncbi:MAG: hypothetical protein KC468_22590, partial [Myxococcales bacterium]|nr:hypothetical protein [Myxococcales bacterium]
MFFVVGASGSGKSSLVRAGVVPRMRASFDEVFITRPSSPARDFPNARPLLLGYIAASCQALKPMSRVGRNKQNTGQPAAQ